LLRSIYAHRMSRPSRDQSLPVGNRIEQARSERGLSRGELADLVGVHYQTMGYLERGEYNPSLELALKIARALDTPLEAIFWLDTGVGDDVNVTSPKGVRNS
jgi:putative transcriptional regulator